MECWNGPNGADGDMGAFTPPRLGAQGLGPEWGSGAEGNPRGGDIHPFLQRGWPTQTSPTCPPILQIISSVLLILVIKLIILNSVK